MKKSLLIGLLFLTAFLYVTNPDKEDFKEYIAARIEREIQKETSPGDQTAEIFKPFAEGLARLGAGLGATFSRRDNYYLFSIYTLDLPDPEGGRQAAWKYLGIAKMFIPLQQKQAEN